MIDVDVLLPIRDPHLPWLRQALLSIEQQEGLSVRIVAVIHPDSAYVRSEIEQLRVPTSVVWAPRDGNIADALNVGLAECQATLVARMDADDVAEVIRLKEQRDLLSTQLEYAAVASSVALIDHEDRTMGVRRVPKSERSLSQWMRWKCPFSHPSTMFRREVVEALGGYSHEAAGAEDYELWLRLLVVSKIAAIQEPLLRYRIHADQISTRAAPSQACVRAVRQARLALADARGESRLAAQVRQSIWSQRQVMRRLSRAAFSPGRP